MLLISRLSFLAMSLVNMFFCWLIISFCWHSNSFCISSARAMQGRNSWDKNPIFNQFKTLKIAQNRQKPSELKGFSPFSLFPTSSTGSTMTVNYAPGAMTFGSFFQPVNVVLFNDRDSAKISTDNFLLSSLLFSLSHSQ